MGSLGPSLFAFALGILIADAGWLSPGWALSLIAPLCGLALWRRVLRVPTRLILFLIAGAFWITPVLEAAPVAVLRTPLVAVLEGRVVDAAGTRLVLEDPRRVDGDLVLPRRILLRAGSNTGSVLTRAKRGDRLRVRARVVPLPERRNPGGRDLRRSLRRQGIGAQAWLSEPAQVLRLHEGNALRRRADLLEGFTALRRNAVSALLERGVGGALFAALVFGEREGLADEQDWFRALGISHLLAISGLHLALVGLAAYRIALTVTLRVPGVGRTWCTPRDPRVGALALTSLATGLYAILSGAATPVRRAWWVGALLAATWCLRRPVRRAAPLHLAAAILLVGSPSTLFHTGAQLSFAACYALVFGAAPAHARHGGLRRSAEVIAATAPVAAATIGVISAWGLVANAIAVPWTALVVLPCAFVAVAALGLPGGVGEVVLAFCLRVAELSLAAVAWAAAIAPAPFHVAPSSVALLVAAGLAVLVVRTPSIAAKIGGAALIPPLLAWWPVPMQRPLVPRAVFLDVGQGDASLVQGPRAAVLIDGGRARPGTRGHGAATVLPALDALGVKRLDLVIASHRDLDHRGGLERVVAGTSVGALWVPWGAKKDPALGALIRVAARRGVPVVERGQDAPPTRVGSLRITPLWPPRDWAGSANDGSLVVRVDVLSVGGPATRLLFPGDVEGPAEAALLARPASLRASVLKLSHHGSRTSSSLAFLEAVAPEVVIASSALFHRFGMPHAVVCRRAQHIGAPLWHTGTDGAVWVSLGTPRWVRGTTRLSTPRACDRRGRPPPRGSPIATTARPPQR